MKSKDTPVVTCEMLIRKPAPEAFEAFVDPEITSNFWFTEGSSRLEEDKSVDWTWGQFGITATIEVHRVKNSQFISFDWSSGEGESDYRTVEISFESKSDDTTFVQVVEKGFTKDDQLVEKIAGQTEGWTLVLSGLKAWLEHGINLNLIGDHKPV